MAAPIPSEVGERRKLTVLFCDLVGSTPLSQQLEAEEWRDLNSRYQRAATEAVEKFGGHVAENLGDGLLIYFGWPAARTVNLLPANQTGACRLYGADDTLVDASRWRAAPISNASTRTCKGA